VTKYPSDPQAAAGLRKCMNILADMDVVWPSAGRQLELLRGSKLYLELKERGGDFSRRGREGYGQKRLAEQDLEAEKETWPEIKRETPHQHLRQFPGPRPYPRQRTSSMTLVSETHPKPLHGHARSSSVIPSSTIVGPPPAAVIPLSNVSSPVAFSPSFERWISEMEWPFSETLSTSVFSPFYGTSNTDEYGTQRHPIAAPHLISPLSTTFQSVQHDPHSGDTNRGRHPDSWDDTTGAGQQLYPVYDASLLSSAGTPEPIQGNTMPAPIFGPPEWYTQ
jgi:hypothetical protein